MTISFHSIALLSHAIMFWQLNLLTLFFFISSLLFEVRTIAVSVIQFFSYSHYTYLGASASVRVSGTKSSIYIDTYEWVCVCVCVVKCR